MRILVLTQYFWPENFRINDLVAGLVERGHQIVVLTGLPNYPEGTLSSGYQWLGPYQENYGLAKIVRVPLIPRGNGGGLMLMLNYLSFALSATLLGAFRCRGGYDAILVYEPSPVTVGIPARALSWLKSAPIFFWVQDLWPESLSATGAVKSPSVLKSVEYLVRWIYRGCDRILAQSEAFFDPIKKLGVSKERILYFPNSAEAFYHRFPEQTEWEGPPLPDGFRVMFAGNIGTAQSFETMLAAAEKLLPYKQIQWVILGDGRLSEWVRKEIDRRGLGGCFHLMGRFPVESMPQWFSKANVMLVTLRRDPIFAMTVPAKVQSYMASSKPIIASLDGEGARIVTLSAAGIAVPAEDPQALADAVLQMYETPEAERQAMGEHGRKFFESHFDREVLLDRLESWLTDFIKREK